MPRNPSKTRCTVPGCRNWSMRDHTRCRAHCGPELGTRGAGAPRGNLNALKHGRYSDPISTPDLESLVDVATKQPEDLAYQVGLLVCAIQNRIGDPTGEAWVPGMRSFRILLAVNRVLDKLTARLASTLLHAHIAETLSPLPPGVREHFQAKFEEVLTSHEGPTQALLLFEKVRRQRNQRKNETR